tara:strand:- start:720 stop:1169 length:450 start_codon:yes stop_codon:yes gene_type:complete
MAKSFSRRKFDHLWFSSVVHCDSFLLFNVLLQDIAIVDILNSGGLSSPRHPPSPMGLISEVFILVKNAAIYTSENLESLHWIVEGVLFLFIIYQFVQKQYKPKSVKLTKKEEDELIEEWDPEPLVPQLSERQLLDLSTAPQIKVFVAAV